jgi:hypothetical protein
MDRAVISFRASEILHIARARAYGTTTRAPMEMRPIVDEGHHASSLFRVNDCMIATALRMNVSANFKASGSDAPNVLKR